MACRTRLLHVLPQVPRLFPFGETPITLRSDDDLRPFPRQTPHRLQKPLVNIPFPIRYVHDERIWTALLDLTRQLIPCQPAGTLLLCKGFAVALLCHRRLQPLPHFQPQDSQVQARRGQGHRGMKQMRLTNLDLHGPHPLLRPRCTVIQKGRVLHSQDHLLRPNPLQRGVVMS